MKSKLIVLLGVASVLLAGAALATPPIVSSAGAAPVFKKGSICWLRGTIEDNKTFVRCPALGDQVRFEEIYARGWRVVTFQYILNVHGNVLSTQFIIEEQ